jgi:hypothetical protein
VIDLLVILVVLAVAVTFVTAPLRCRQAEGGEARAEGRSAAGGGAEVEGGVCAGPAAPLDSELAELEAAREAKLREIRDAELDHRTGKLSDEDFELVSSALRKEAVTILRAIDTISGR